METKFEVCVEPQQIYHPNKKIKIIYFIILFMLLFYHEK